MKLTGAEIVVRALKDEGVKHIFGYPGGAVLNIFDALYDEKDISVILTRHEQGAVHAADGYARVSGNVGVCMVTSGPGATNTVTGIATAYMDSIPLVVITGQVPVSLIGNDAFQEADIVGITRPCTKHNYLIKRVEDLERILKEAFYLARTGRPGPVLVDIPKDVTAASCKYGSVKEVDLPGYKPKLRGHPLQVRRAVKMILSSKRPVLYVGGGVVISGAHQELFELATRLSIPVTTTLMALGAFPGDHELSLGMLGMHGTYRANMAVTEADLLIAVGARFDDRVTGKVEEFSPHAKIIHIDIDPTSISKNIKVDIPIVGDARLVLKDILKELDRISQEKPGILEEYRRDLESWHAKIKKWHDQSRLSYDLSGPYVKPQYVVEVLYRLTKGEAIVSTDVGQNQMWAAQYYIFKKPRSFLTSGGLGTMGYGFPAGIGAKVAAPEREVVVISGDGSFQMNLQELATAVKNNLNVKVIILNNGYLGMVRQWQELFYNRRYSHSYLGWDIPDFVKLAEAYGASGYRVERNEEVENVLKKALSEEKPTIVDVRINPEENVYPMVPAGAPLKEMILV